MPYRVVFSPEADAQLVNLYRYIARDSSPTTAERFTAATIDYCEGFETFPQRGARRAARRSAFGAAHGRIPPQRNDRFHGRRRNRDDHRRVLWRSGFRGGF